MKKHNVLTGPERSSFSRLRNRSLGSLRWSQVSLKNILNTDAVGQLDKILLRQALDNISNVIDNWDKHYCAKLFKKLNEENLNE